MVQKERVLSVADLLHFTRLRQIDDELIPQLRNLQKVVETEEVSVVLLTLSR